MTARRDDAEIARLEKRLQDAQDELAAARRRGRDNEPMIEQLGKHLRDNRFAERLVASLRDSRRHA